MIPILIIGICVLFLWWFFHEIQMDFCVDLTRQRLFKIRDELFDYAADGNVSFDSKAYGLCRKTINGMIRFCHDLHWIRIAIMGISLYFQKDLDKQYQKYIANRENAHNDLDPETREKIDQIYRQMHRVVIIHLVHTSLLLLTLTYLAYWIARIISRTEELVNWVIKSSTPAMDQVDAQANAMGVRRARVT